jgi:hemerythrin-like domain-containing protein
LSLSFVISSPVADYRRIGKAFGRNRASGTAALSARLVLRYSRSAKDLTMATKAKTKANRTAERKSSGSQTASRSKERQQASRNAFDVLEQDHREVEEWFDEYDELKDSDEDDKADLAKKICFALKVHAQIEEEIFYPRAREASQNNDLIDEALVEHSTVKNLIGEIEAMEVGDELYDAKVRVLGEMVKQHIKEEEEELFPELQSTKMDLDAVGKELVERKQELMAEMST